MAGAKLRKCGRPLIQLVQDRRPFFRANYEYVGASLCRDCLEEHCVQTNCLQCDIEIGQAAATPTSSGRGCRRQKKAVRLMPDQHREVIDRFTGPYAFLSNFHPCRVTFYGMTFPSVEAAFQAAKCADHRDRAQFLAMTPEQAKRRGRQIRMRDDWDARKRTIMHNLLVHKFSENPDLIPKLLATGGAVLVEGNTWHDNYWGCCTLFPLWGQTRPEQSGTFAHGAARRLYGEL